MTGTERGDKIHALKQARERLLEARGYTLRVDADTYAKIWCAVTALDIALARYLLDRELMP